MPADVVGEGKRCLVDGFGVILAGSTLQGSAIVRDYVRSVGERKEATAVGAGGFMTSAAHAALVNAASGHAMDYDDTQLSTTPDRTFGLLTHPTVPALAAALASPSGRRPPARRFSRRFSSASKSSARSPRQSTPSTTTTASTRPARSARSAPRPPPRS